MEIQQQRSYSFPHWQRGCSQTRELILDTKRSPVKWQLLSVNPALLVGNTIRRRGEALPQVAFHDWQRKNH
jgi:hypothetical protein